MDGHGAGGAPEAPAKHRPQLEVERHRVRPRRVLRPLSVAEGSRRASSGDFRAVSAVGVGDPWPSLAGGQVDEYEKVVSSTIQEVSFPHARALGGSPNISGACVEIQSSSSYRC